MSHFWIQTKIDWLMKFTSMMWFLDFCIVLAFWRAMRKNSNHFIIKQSYPPHTMCYIMLRQHCTGMFETYVVWIKHDSSEQIRWSWTNIRCNQNFRSNFHLIHRCRVKGSRVQHSFFFLNIRHLFYATQFYIRNSVMSSSFTWKSLKFDPWIMIYNERKCIHKSLLPLLAFRCMAQRT